MKPAKIFSIALENLKQRRLRTALTMVSVVIGIAAIIGIAALGEGFRLSIKDRMQQGFELDVLVVLPLGTAGIRQPFSSAEIANITNIAGVKSVTGMTTFTGGQLVNENDSKLNAFTVSTVDFSKMQQTLPRRSVPLSGEIPAEGDNDTIVLGYKTCYINETSKPLVQVGDNVTLQTYDLTVNKTFRVAAILQESGASPLTDFDYWAFTSSNPAINSSGYNVLLVKVDEAQNSEKVAQSIEDSLGNPYSFSIIVPIAFMNQVDQILSLVQMFLMSIASISLLVAGIGIMNIMMVSVMERTREIGILKAVGASSRTVLTLFLTEAVLIGLIGGVIGVASGYGLSYGLALAISSTVQSEQRSIALKTAGALQQIDITPAFLPEWIALALVFSVVICIIFGLYPAKKAASLDPVKALQYE